VETVGKGLSKSEQLSDRISPF